ncbi:MAG: hypothetical protein KY396_06085 [Actinobacteria bacterium]|nr:hypothetical protein [Actinomycetota bacterium]
MIELHDEAYNAWGRGSRRGDWAGAERRARSLVERLGPSLGLYLRFYRADNATGTKTGAARVVRARRRCERRHRSGRSRR